MRSLNTNVSTSGLGIATATSICARFVTHYFLEPNPNRTSKDLRKFIEKALSNTWTAPDLEVTLFTALYLLGLLRDRICGRLQADGIDSAKRIFITAFYIAFKNCYDVEDYTSYHEYRGIIRALAEGICAPDIHEADDMEREMCHCLDFRLFITMPLDAYVAFRDGVIKDFGRGGAPYPTYMFVTRDTTPYPPLVPYYPPDDPHSVGKETTAATPLRFRPIEPTVVPPPRVLPVPQAEREDVVPVLICGQTEQQTQMLRFSEPSSLAHPMQHTTMIHNNSFQLLDGGSIPTVPYFDYSITGYSQDQLPVYEGSAASDSAAFMASVSMPYSNQPAGLVCVAPSLLFTHDWDTGASSCELDGNNW